MERGAAVRHPNTMSAGSDRAGAGSRALQLLTQPVKEKA